MMYSTQLSREMFSVPNFPMRKKSGVHISAGNCTNHISQSNVKSFSKKCFSDRQAQTVSNVNPFSENNSLEFLLDEFAEEVSDAHLTAKVKHFFQKDKNSSLFVNDAHSFRFCDLIYTLGDVTTEEAVAAYLISDDVPQELVKSRMLKINSEHIEYIFSCLKSNTTKVRNIKAYLKAVIYNAPVTISNNYSAEVNHDLYGG